MAAPLVRFSPPVIVHGAWNTSRGWRLDGNESMLDSFYALNDNFLFGSYMEHWNLESGEGVFVQSNDSGRSWHLSQILKPQPVQHVPAACQEQLNAFCNNESTVGPDCLDPQTKVFHRNMKPMYALFDKGLTGRSKQDAQTIVDRENVLKVEQNNLKSLINKTKMELQEAEALANEKLVKLNLKRNDLENTQGGDRRRRAFFFGDDPTVL